jgi:hypothetical protein
MTHGPGFPIPFQPTLRQSALPCQRIEPRKPSLARMIVFRLKEGLRYRFLL